MSSSIWLPLLKLSFSPLYMTGISTVLDFVTNVDLTEATALYFEEGDLRFLSLTLISHSSLTSTFSQCIPQREELILLGH